MPVAVVATGNTGIYGSFPWTFDPSTGTMLLLGLSERQNTTGFVVTVSGDSATVQESATDFFTSGGVATRTGVTSGTKSLDFTSTANHWSRGLSAVAISGQDGTTPIRGTAVEDITDGATLTIDVPSAVGDTVFAFYHVRSGGNVVTVTGATKLSSTVAAEDGIEYGWAESDGSATVTVTVTNTANTNGVLFGISIIPDGAPPAAPDAPYYYRRQQAAMIEG